MARKISKLVLHQSTIANKLSSVQKSKAPVYGNAVLAKQSILATSLSPSPFYSLSVPFSRCRQLQSLLTTVATGTRLQPHFYCISTTASNFSSKDIERQSTLNSQTNKAGEKFLPNKDDTDTEVEETIASGVAQPESKPNLVESLRVERRRQYSEKVWVEHYERFKSWWISVLENERNNNDIIYFKNIRTNDSNNNETLDTDQFSSQQDDSSNSLFGSTKYHSLDSNNTDSTFNKQAMHERFADIAVPKDQSLRVWLKNNRYFYQQQKCVSVSSFVGTKGAEQQQQQQQQLLYDRRLAMLEQLQLEYNYPFFPRQVLWEKRFRDLQSFVAKHGCFPYEIADEESLKDNNDDYYKLLYWCQLQRTEYKIWKEEQQQQQKQLSDKSGTATQDTVGNVGILTDNKQKWRSSTYMTQERVDKLDAIGFVWNMNDESWLKNYEKLKKYQQIHGDCLVPSTYLVDPELARWTREQRFLYKQAKKDDNCFKLLPERQKLLDEIGFVWNVDDAKWKKKYEEYTEFVRTARPGMMPSRKNMSLFNWIRHQRVLYEKYLNGKKTSMTEERKNLLEAVGIQLILESHHDKKARNEKRQRKS